MLRNSLSIDRLYPIGDSNMNMHYNNRNVKEQS